MIIKRKVIILLSVVLMVLINNWVMSVNVNSFHSNGILHDEVKKVFTALGESFETLEEANSFAQKHLLRQGERWDKQKETPVFQACKEKEDILMIQLKTLGMVDAVRPTQKHFKYALCMGALCARVQQRLDLIADLQKDGYSFDYIVLLGGERPLLATEKDALPEDINTEAEMMKHLYEKHPNIQKSQLIYVNVPMVKLPNGTSRRPNTDDTLELFAAMAPEGGSCLVVSNNPYLYRQIKVTQRILHKEKFSIGGAGSALDKEKVDIHIAMDEFARAIYEECKAFK